MASKTDANAGARERVNDQNWVLVKATVTVRGTDLLRYCACRTFQTATTIAKITQLETHVFCTAL